MSQEVVIVGISGTRNRGVEALLRPVVEDLVDGEEGHGVTVLTRSPDYDARRFAGIPARWLRDPFEPVVGRRERLRRGLAGVAPNAHPSWTAAAHTIARAGCVVAMGGDVFSADYGDQERYLAPLRLAVSHSVPVVFLGQSVGPYRDPEPLESFAAVAREAAAVGVRESVSQEYVRAAAGVPDSRIRLLSDPAFCLARSDAAGLALRQTYGIGDRDRVVVLCPSEGITGYARGGDAERHDDAWIGLASALLTDPGRTVLLLAHVQEVWPENDDRRICERIADRVGSPRVRCVVGDHSAVEFKSLISTAELVVTERMHSGIAGLSTGVVTLVIGYSVKARGIVDDLVGEDLGSRLVLPFSEFLGGSGAEAVSLLERDRDSIRDQIARGAEKARVSAEGNAQLVREMASL